MLRPLMSDKSVAFLWHFSLLHRFNLALSVRVKKYSGLSHKLGSQKSSAVLCAGTDWLIVVCHSHLGNTLTV